ncbi:MAG: glycosyltransferase, partial [Daejeonella sp.]
MAISVIICCYNSSDKLPQTLKALSQQISISDIDCEIILVNNNSTDDTVEVAVQTWAALGEPFPLHIVNEDKAGLSFAREKGIASGKYEYVVFCDDDNWLCEEYLYKVNYLFGTKPEVALIGGVGEAVFEIAVPDWFNELNGFGYAIGAEGRETGYVESVYGAGMAMRKAVFTERIKDDFDFILSDRKGNSLVSGGDTEISMLVSLAGYKIYLDTTLTFKHFLPPGRMDWRYYLKLRRSFGKANAYLSIYREQLFPQLVVHRETSFLKKTAGLLKMIARNFPLSVFPVFYKSAYCANLTQEIALRMAYITENKK